MVSGFCTHGNYFTNTVGVVVEIDDSLATPDIAYTRDRLGNVLSAVAEGVSTNLYAYSREGLLTNEVQNGVQIARNYDVLDRPTGYACRSADEEVETRSSPEPGDQGVRLSAQVGTGAEDMRDDDSPIPARSLSVREAVSTASGLCRDSGFSPRSGQAVHQGEGVPYGVEYTYDAFGRLSTVSSEEGGASPPGEPFSFTYDYLPGTDLVSGYASGDFFRSVSYEPDRNLIAYVENSFGDAVVSRFDYTNDALGRRTAIARSGTAFSSLSGAVDAYGYNGRSEVTSARRTLGGDEVRGFAFDYAYDPIGNRTSSAEYDENGVKRLSLYESNELNEYTRRTVAGHATVLGEADADAAVTVNGAPAWRKGPYFYGGVNVFNATNAVFAELAVEAVRDLGGGTNAVDTAVVNRFVAETPERFAYDADGNMTSDGRWTYIWNGENRLVCAVEAVHPTNRAPRVVEYAYDHLGRMVWKTIGETNGPPDKALSYTWDDYNIIRERKNGVNTYNIWGLDLDGTMQGCGGVGGLLAVVKDDEVYTPTYDANGNISEYVSSNGTTVAHQEYDPFGNAVVSSGDADTFTHWFSTKPWCGVTGMVEYQYRKYRPGMGRWMNRDSSTEFGGWNIYACCLNNLLQLVDIIGYYVVQIGDTGGKIANMYGISLSALVKANPEININMIRSGLWLQLPPKRDDLPYFDDPTTESGMLQLLFSKEIRGPGQWSKFEETLESIQKSMKAMHWCICNRKDVLMRKLREEIASGAWKTLKGFNPRRPNDSDQTWDADYNKWIKTVYNPGKFDPNAENYYLFALGIIEESKLTCERIQEQIAEIFDESIVDQLNHPPDGKCWLCIMRTEGHALQGLKTIGTFSGRLCSR